ncbi:MAG: hypothetical protein LRY71_04945 [Bacillaceae bacterium]|nr:hypothetical protein [Bacillaceae bacterium]
MPIIFVIVNNLCDLSKVRWQEIKNETFQYDIHFYPVWNCSDVNRAVAEQVWNYTLDYYRLLTCHKPLKQHKPLDKRTLRSLGIYPQKGTLLIGNDADYLLFNENQFLSANNKCLLNPSVVVLRGKVIKAGGTMFIYPGNGKEITINLPRRFVPIDEAYPIKTID